MKLWRKKQKETSSNKVKINFVFLNKVEGLDVTSLRKRLALAGRKLNLQRCINVVFCNSKLSTRLNLKYRKKNYAPDVLTFKYDENQEADIIINSDLLGQNPNTTSLKLALHAMVHLTELDHEKPEQQEDFFRLEQELIKDFFRSA